MKLRHTLIACALVSMMATACTKNDTAATGQPASGENAEQSTPTAEQPMQTVTLLDGTVTVKIPESLPLVAQQGDVHVYGGNEGAVTLAAGQSPGGDAASLIDQTVANLKSADPDLKIIAHGDATIGGQPAKTVELTMKTNGTDAHMSMTIAVVSDNLVSIQVLGPKDKPEEVNARAKAIIDSVSVASSK